MATKARAPRASKKSTIAVDFSDTETQATIEEGDYALIVDDVEKKESENSGADYLSITFKIKDGEFEGKKVYHNCSLQPQALFNLRGVLEALGFEVPTGVMELDPADMIGESCGAALAHETYQGKTKARPVEFFPEGDLESRGEEPAPKAKPKAAAAPTKVVKKGAKPEPVEEEEEEAPPPKSKVKGKTKAKALAEGDKVTFTDDEGDEQEGVISGIEDDTYSVTVGTGKKAEVWELELADLTAA